VHTVFSGRQVMGAWGYGPLDDDIALDWLAEEVEAPLLAAIKKALHAYSDQPEKDDARTIEAVAAAALLVDLTGHHTRMKYAHFHTGYLGHAVREADLWSLAVGVVERIIEEEDTWLRGWNDPAQKVQALRQLVADLQEITAANKNR
jgi:hypothetical protein